LFEYGSCHDALPHSFPTRRSSDLGEAERRWVATKIANTATLAASISQPHSGQCSSCPSTSGTTNSSTAAERLTRPGRSSPRRRRSEEHTSALQSPESLVCRLLLEK